MDALLAIGERVKSIRRSQKLKQTDLASMAGIGLTTVYRLENGENVSTEAFMKALAVLGLDEILLRSLDSVSRKGDRKTTPLVKANKKECANNKELVS